MIGGANLEDCDLSDPGEDVSLYKGVNSVWGGPELT